MGHKLTFTFSFNHLVFLEGKVGDYWLEALQHLI